jgi:hypothetical protein
MKKIHYINLLLFLLFTGNANTQVTGVKFAPDSTRWGTEFATYMGPPPPTIGFLVMQIEGDTVINSKYCQKLYKPNTHSYDTTCLQFYGYMYYYNKRLYIDSTMSIDTNSTLLYDFNLDAGDTFLFYDYYNILGHNGIYKMPVDSVDSMYYGNKWGKRITFKKMSGFYFGGPIRWVEGIGDIDHGFFIDDNLYGNFEFCYYTGGYEQLNCFQEHSQAEYGFSCNYGSCTVGINNINYSQNIAVYPNPANDKIYIERINNGAMKVSMYDMLGKQVSVAEKTNNQRTEIDVSGIQKGVYILKITINNNSLIKKVVIE